MADLAPPDFATWRLPDPKITSIITAVTAWSELGYRIHRCYPEGHVAGKGKQPVGGWKGLWNKPQSPAAIREMFEPSHPAGASRLFGLVVPMGMVVFDIDHDEKKGFDAVETLSVFCEYFDLLEDKQALPDWPIVQTPSGGYHIYATLPEGFVAKNWVAGAGKFPVPGIDIRTSGGGFVVLPPSVRDSGARYKWLNWRAQVPPATAKMVQALTPPAYTPVVGERREYAPSSPDHRRKRGYVGSVLAGELSKFESAGRGSRNNALNEVALKLAKWVAGGEISEAEVKTAIRSSRTWHELVQDDGLAKCEATLKSGFEEGLKEPKNVPAPRPAEEREKIIGTLAGGGIDLNHESVQGLVKAQDARRSYHQPEVAEATPKWLEQWYEADPITSRATLLLGSMLDRENAHNHFRQIEFKDEDGATTGFVLLCAFRDTVRDTIAGVKEVWMPIDDAIGSSRTHGSPFGAICRFRKAKQITILGCEVGHLMQAFKEQRSRYPASQIGVCMVLEPAAFQTLKLANMSNEIVLAMERSAENETFLQHCQRNSARRGISVSAHWVQP